VVALTFLVGRGSPAQTLTMQDADIAFGARMRNDRALCELVVPLRRLIQRHGRGKLRGRSCQSNRALQDGVSRGLNGRFISIFSVPVEAGSFSPRPAFALSSSVSEAETGQSLLMMKSTSAGSNAPPSR
jgi:hypothetical protein